MRKAASKAQVSPDTTHTRFALDQPAVFAGRRVEIVEDSNADAVFIGIRSLIKKSRTKSTVTTINRYRV
jgi:hypothetical protein